MSNLDSTEVMEGSKLRAEGSWGRTRVCHLYEYLPTSGWSLVCRSGGHDACGTKHHACVA